MSYATPPVRVSAHIEGAPEDVFTFVSDTRNDHLWCPNVTNAVQTVGDGVEIGAEFTFDQTIETGGRRLESSVTVEVLELGDRSIRWRVEDRFQTREIELRVEPSPSGSTVTQTTRAVFKRKPGVARWVYPMLARRTFRDQFGRLAKHFSS